MTNQFFQNVLAQASLLQPAVAVAQQQQPQIALANPTPSLATQAVQGTVPAQLLLQPSQQVGHRANKYKFFGFYIYQ